MGLGHALSRRKALDTVEGEQSELGKVLSTVDLIALGVGSTLGVGVYVLPGIVSRDIAGPGVVLSFLYAAIVSVLAGLCYAEFGARVPKAGSAYIYSYVTIGEFVAYIIGWNLIIEYVIAGASVARGVSLYLDSLFGNAMANYFRSIYAMDVPFLSGYIDFFAFSIAVLVSVFLAVGVKESLLLNNLLTTVNCTVVVFVIIIGSLYADFMNWEIPSSNVPLGSGEGGFLPYGWLGTLRGASTCFYGFVGFDVIATSGEETRNPRRAIPVSIIVSLLIIFLAYFGVSSVLTLMWPYYLQDVGAPLPHVFTELGLDWAKWVVTIGGLFGLSASLFGGMFPLPRVVYAMSQDGLLFEFLSRVHPRFKTPFVGTIFSGILTGTMAAIFNLKDLVDLMSMATLVCYTIVAMSVLILRYRTEGERDLEERFTSESESSPLLRTPSLKKHRFYLRKFPFANIEFSVYILTLLCGLLAYTLVCMQNADSELTMSPYITFTLLLLIILILVLFAGIPFDSTATTFQMPGLPLTPTLSIFANIYLMCLMELSTWYSFSIWLAAGLVIYFGYGLRHSTENQGQHRTLPKVEYERLQQSEQSQSGETSAAQRVIKAQDAGTQEVHLGITYVH
uniref:Cationic amino acid transporter C-terminal domain-containing protein n=1 Tax=Homalodisca liturata TaxID=320908 RepID=A0A1B6IUB3_9HEMI